MAEEKRRFEMENYLAQDILVQPKSRQTGGSVSSSPSQNLLNGDRERRAHPLSRDTILRLIQTLKDR
ncbi:MAG: hypothetical protein IT316_13705 [Anaerolineales bacterium]|nr:hypothetical protein [Anaerolineales bacterium]